MVSLQFDGEGFDDSATVYLQATAGKKLLYNAHHKLHTRYVRKCIDVGLLVNAGRYSEVSRIL